MMWLLAQYSLHAAAVGFLVGLALQLQREVDKYCNFAIAALYTVCPYVLVTCLHAFRCTLFTGLCISLAITGVVGIVLEMLVSAPLRRRGAHSDVQLLASIGLYIVVTNIVAMVWGDETRYCAIVGFEKSTRGTGAIVSALTTVMLACWVVVGGSMILWLRMTASGKVFRAACASLDLAQSVGIEIRNICLAVAFMAAAIAGSAGVLAGVDISMSPGMGLDAALVGIVVAVLANALSVLRLSISAILVALLNCFAGYLLHIQWQNAVMFGILLFVICYRGIMWRTKGHPVALDAL